MHPHSSARRRLLLILTVTSLISATAVADDEHETYVNQTCSPKLNYTDDSPYGKNVASLLSTMTGPAAAVIDNWWFRTATVGDASGLAMCFADSDPSWCRKCFAYLTSNMSIILLPMCYHSRNVSFVSTDGCVIRYADAPFFGTVFSNSGPAELVLSKPGHAFDGAAALREARRTLLGQLAEIAGGDGRRFATGSQGYMVGRVWQVMYGMAQCTRDLPASECSGCLIDLLAVMYRDVSVTNSTEAYVMGFSCYLKYQMDEPIHIAGIALPPAAPPPPPPAWPPTGSAATPSLGGKMTVLIAALAAAAVTLRISVIGI